MKKRYLIVLSLTLIPLWTNMAYAIDPNLVAYWAFDETSGTTAHDSAGTHDGTVSGAQWTSDGKFGNALNFNGSAYVNIGDLGLNGDWTVCFWAKSNNNSGIIYYPIGLGSPDKGIFMGELIYKLDNTRGFMTEIFC